MKGSLPKTKEEARNRKQISATFRRFRAQQGLNQHQLAQLIGVNWQTICMIETCKVTPHYRTQSRFIELLQRHEAEKQRRKDARASNQPAS